MILLTLSLQLLVLCFWSQNDEEQKVAFGNLSVFGEPFDRMEDLSDHF